MCYLLFCFVCDGDHRDRHVLTHAFPTRRSSDLGAGEGLAAGVVRRRLRHVRLADLQVVAVDAVVADLQRRDAAGLAFTLLEVDEELVGAGRQPAQFGEFGIVVVGEHAAVAWSAWEIGSASWREGGCQYVEISGVAVPIKK